MPAGLYLAWSVVYALPCTAQRAGMWVCWWLPTGRRGCRGTGEIQGHSLGKVRAELGCLSSCILNFQFWCHSRLNSEKEQKEGGWQEVDVGTPKSRQGLKIGAGRRGILLPLGMGDPLLGVSRVSGSFWKVLVLAGQPRDFWSMIPYFSLALGGVSFLQESELVLGSRVIG